MIKSARQIAYEILLKIEKDKAYSNLAIDSAVKEYSSSSTDISFISHLVYGVTERKLTLDYVISKYLKTPINRLKKDVLTILRLGVYQLFFSEKVPESAAVNESVKLTKANKCSYASSLVNAVLRNASKDGFSIDEKLDTYEKISVEYSAPLELVKFLMYHYGEENTKAFLKASLETKKIYIRVNTTKVSTKKLTEILISEGIGVTDTFLEDSLEINLNKAVYELDSFKKGYFHVEDLSSQLCVKALSPFEGCTAIDICSAPGGKSFTIAEYMNNNGKLISCDLYEHRTTLISEGAKRLGLTCIEAKVNDATIFDASMPEADVVLCDVPCSGMGIICKKPEIKYKKLDDIKEIIPIQKEILHVSSRYVKKRGRLVYSTCSVNPNENRKVCDDFLKNHPDFILCRVLQDVPRTIDEGDYLTLMMHTNNCDGFFIAAFERK